MLRASTAPKVEELSLVWAFALVGRKPAVANAAVHAAVKTMARKKTMACEKDMAGKKECSCFIFNDLNLH